MLTQARLVELLRFDSSNGQFFWRFNRGGKRADSVAGNLRSDDYIQIKVDGRLYLAHRLVWLYVYGVWPKDELDHRDRLRSNNRLENLREATHGQNMANFKTPNTNKSGHKGVYWHVASKKWAAFITANGSQIWLGLFEDKEAACVARAEAEKKYHGEFARAA